QVRSDVAQSSVDRRERGGVELAAVLFPRVVTGLVPEDAKVADDEDCGWTDLGWNLLLGGRLQVRGETPEPLAVPVELEVGPAVLDPVAVEREARGQEVKLSERVGVSSSFDEFVHLRLEFAQGLRYPVVEA